MSELTRKTLNDSITEFLISSGRGIATCVNPLDLCKEALSDIERGKKNITIKTLYKISAILNINPVELFVYTRTQQES